MDKNFKKYIIFWLSQSASQLGSQMTGFALILWAYAKSGSAMTVSLMSFFQYVPYILVSAAAGSFVDRHDKKKIMLISDLLAAACSAAVFVIVMADQLQVAHIYAVNLILGLANAFQQPASSVAVGKLVPEEKIAQASGMNSFSSNLVMVLAPVFSASLFAFGGLSIVLLIDLASFAVAFLVLLFLIRIPQEEPAEQERRKFWEECREGFSYLRDHRRIFTVVLTMALLNFFSRLTYENILSPMILARSGNDPVALGIVNAVMGIGGIAGGMVVATGKFSGDGVRMIYLSALLSFLFGDLLMGAGQNVWLWSVAALMASFPIPFINAGQNVLMYRDVPERLWGRIFAVRNAIQFSTIPLGILLGGFLADHVFEPFMKEQSALARLLSRITGYGNGSGMAVMFLCTGLLGSLFSAFFYFYETKKADR